MKKLLTFLLPALLIASCGAPETEIDSDQVYQIITVKGGELGGISIGDSWADAEKTMEKLHDGFFTAENHEVLGTFDTDYGMDGRNVAFECELAEEKIKSIMINIADIEANAAKIDALHEKLVKFYMEKYPEGYTYITDDYSSSVLG